jgi:Domain of unknown function (DUF4956)
MDYDVLLLSLAIDLVAIAVLTYPIYFHRHRRRDLTLGFVGVNVGLFAVASFVSTRPIGLAFGIGLFALLSVIRLRSTQITQEEIGYYFVAIVIGLLNGLSPEEHWGVTITITVVLVGVMYVVDHPLVLRRYQRRIVTLNSVSRDDEKMKRVLERKLGGDIVKVVVLDLDFVHKRTKVDVRYRPRPAVERREAEPGEPVLPIAASGAVAADETAVGSVPTGLLDVPVGDGDVPPESTLPVESADDAERDDPTAQGAPG